MKSEIRILNCLLLLELFCYVVLVSSVWKNVGVTFITQYKILYSSCYGKLECQLHRHPAMVHFLDKLQHGPLSWQTSNMVYLLDKYLTWFTCLTNIQHFTFLTNIRHGSLSWQISNMVQYIYHLLKKKKPTMVQCPHAFLPPFWQISNMAVHAVDKHPTVHLGKHLTWFILTNI